MSNKNNRNVREVRQRLGLTQKDFWDRVGTNQSVGSRYEIGKHEIPAPIQSLLTLAYGTEKESRALVESLRRIKKT